MMEELERILREHAKRYPKMQPTDAVKLIYQNEFGGGHLIKDRQACLDYLRKEYESVHHDPDMPCREPIGNGMVRVHLAAVKPEELEQLGDDFIRSANTHTGSMENFLKKLDVLRKVTAAGHFAFGSDAGEMYLILYQMAGYSPVSHSQTYRQHYHPAYRVVKVEK